MVLLLLQGVLTRFPNREPSKSKATCTCSSTCPIDSSCGFSSSLSEHEGPEGIACGLQV